MRERVRTLVIDANGLTWKSIVADTLLRRAVGGLPSPAILPISKRLSRQVWGRRNESLSYVLDWREAICERNELAVDVCNITDLLEYQRGLRRLKQYPLIIILHSATGDSMTLLQKGAGWFQGRRGKLVVFVGNEYNLLEDKIKFLKSIRADVVCSQLPFEAARWLYADCADSLVLSLPHALNPKVYFPVPEWPQTVDIGFIGDFYHYLIGDTERTRLIEFFRQRGKDHDLTCDIRSRRLPRPEWANFLRSCRGILGAESGTYYLDRKGDRAEAARRYMRTHRGASFEEVHSLFFAQAPREISGKAVSSRHFEPIGTKTCQLLIEGEYNGILKADEHYIAVKKDFSNMEEVIRRFKDQAYRVCMVNRTYDYVLSAHTYGHRIDSLMRVVMRDLPT